MKIKQKQTKHWDSKKYIKKITNKQTQKNENKKITNKQTQMKVIPKGMKYPKAFFFPPYTDFISFHSVTLPSN